MLVSLVQQEIIINRAYQEYEKDLHLSLHMAVEKYKIV